MRFSLFSHFLAVLLLRPAVFPSPTYKRNSLSPHLPMGLFSVSCWSVRRWIQMKSLLSLIRSWMSLPSLAWVTNIQLHSLGPEVPASGTVILQQSYNWVNKPVHPCWWFNKSSSGWMSYFLRLKRVYSFLQTLICELCHLKSIRNLSYTLQLRPGQIRGLINIC